ITSAEVLVTNTSSAFARSFGVTAVSTTATPSCSASSSKISRVMPGRMWWSAGWVRRVPPNTANRLALAPSVIRPSRTNTASNASARTARCLASTLGSSWIDLMSQRPQRSSTDTVACALSMNVPLKKTITLRLPGVGCRVSGLRNRPRLSAAEQAIEAGRVGAEACRAGLCVHLGLEGGCRVAVQDAEGDGERRRLEPGEQLGGGAVALVVDQDVGRRGRDHLQLQLARHEPQPLVAALPEQQRLAVLHGQLGLGGDLLGGEVVEDAVVEHDAVLEHFDERR